MMHPQQAPSVAFGFRPIISILRPSQSPALLVPRALVVAVRSKRYATCITVYADVLLRMGFPPNAVIPFADITFEQASGDFRLRDWLSA